MKLREACVFAFCLAGVAGCGGDSSPSAPGGGGSALVAPSLSSPADAAQLSTLRPTFVVANAASGQSGARTYEFQISDKSDFSASGASSAGFVTSAGRAGVAEGAGGTTSYTPDSDLQPATRMYWRARVVQGSTTSDWSPARSFGTQIVGYSRSNELYDPLYGGSTIGTAVGATAFVPGRGIQLLNEDAHVRYLLQQTISTGEMSVEVEGLYGNGPGGKLKIMSMFDGTGNLYASKYLFNVQYRGLDGNPDNSISFKALFGDNDWKYEPDFNQRAAAVMSLNPARTYVWRALWSNSVRVVLQDGRGGPTLYDLSIPAPAGTYAPSPHYAYIGASRPPGEETGTWPGAIFRNLWIGTGTRPPSLGSAVSDYQPY